MTPNGTAPLDPHAIENLLATLRDICGDTHVLTDPTRTEDYAHDEALGVQPVQPAGVVKPADTAEVSQVVAACHQAGIPLTARGAGTGLSGAATPRHGGIVVSLERMNACLEIDLDNHSAVVQPGLQLNQLDELLAPHQLVYPVFPGEYSASLGGNVNTNAGGMRAVKYGVTRHHILGLEVVLADGTVLRLGGKVVKSSTGYDLLQLVVGSEGTLCVVTEVTLKLQPRQAHQATLLVPFATLEDVTQAVPRIVDSGLHPMILEYIDLMTMSVMTTSAGLDLGIPEEIKATALAYLVIVTESTSQHRLDEDVTALAELAATLGALDIYVLPSGAGHQIIEAREQAFWLAKANNADDVIDTVVPRAQIPAFMSRVAELATEYSAWVVGCGHAGDGNVHLGIFLADAVQRESLLRNIFATAMELGGAISGEHGIGTAKRHFFLELEDPAKVALMQRVKAAFDPKGILNPGAVF
jgi:glycolate oxidase